MAPRLSGQTSIFGAVLFVSKSLFGIEDKRNLKIYNFDLKSSAPFQNIDISNVKVGFKRWSFKNSTQFRQKSELISSLPTKRSAAQTR